MARKSIPISLRFVFNRNAAMNGEAGGLAREFGPRSARIIARDVAIEAAEDAWQTIERSIKAKILKDANREVSAVAQQYRQLIIGATGARQGVSGTIKGAAQTAFGSERAPEQRFQLDWDARSVNYLRRKFKDKGHLRWFEYGGGLKGGVRNPVNQQLQNAMGKASTWLRAFGPIGIRVTRRSQSLKESGFRNNLDTGVRGGGGVIRLSVATVTVTAFGRITPTMLPAMSPGGISAGAPDGRDTGLIGLFPASIAYRLGGSREHVPYRPTLEPFLGFFLTRSLPNAVMRRLQDGLLSDIRPN